MADTILIKLASEIALKTHFVRAFFEKKLLENLKNSFKSNNLGYGSILKKRGRLFLKPEEENSLSKFEPVLQHTFGLHSYVFASHFNDSLIENMKEKAVDYAKKYLKEGNSFMIRVNRIGNQDYSSKEVEEKVGAAVFNSMKNLKVDLTNPEKSIFIEIQNNEFFIYSKEKEVKCRGGLPLGSQGSLMVYCNGRKEEVIAAWLLMKRGALVFPVIENNANAISNADKIKENFSHLKEWNAYRDFIFTDESDEPAVKELISKYNCNAIIKADRDTGRDKFNEYKEFDERKEMLVLRPLLLYPEKKYREIEKLVFGYSVGSA